MKTCSYCKVEKSLDSFHNRKRSKDGKYVYCKECSKEVRSKRYYANIEKETQRGKEYYSNNKPKFRARLRKYQASKKNRTPQWLNEKDLFDIETKYAIANWLSIIVGIPYHVDHIIPLQGKNVSGLHVPTNLQILRASDNLSKGNKHYG